MHLSVCNILSPQTGLETKFSLRHTASLSALGYDTAAIATYSDEHAGKPDLVSMRERVVVIGDHADGTSARVIVHHQRGRAEAEIDVGIPTTDFDEQESRLRGKFNSLAGDALGKLKTKALADMIGTFERLDRISPLIAAAALPSGRG
jgi:2-methylcitrate dehydratase PrpD